MMALAFRVVQTHTSTLVAVAAYSGAASWSLAAPSGQAN